MLLDASFVLRYVLHTQAVRPHAAGLQLLQNGRPRAERDLRIEPVGRCTVCRCEPQPELARAYGLSACDALYFELALRRIAALATYDDVMIAAAPSAGIRLYPPVVAARELS